MRLAIRQRGHNQGSWERGYQIGHTVSVTTKEQLHRLVDELAEEQADRARMLLETVAGDASTAAPRPRLSASLGAGASGRSNLSERVDKVLAQGFGR